MTQRKLRSPQVLSIAVVVMFLVLTGLPAHVLAAEGTRAGAWDTAGTRWATTATVSGDEAARFNELWTQRFLNSLALEEYLNRPGLYDDGFNALSEDQKAFLVVGLIRHWDATLPAFGKDFWTGDPAKDQEKSNELATMVYATIFAKDEFFGALKAAASQTPQNVPQEVDTGHEEFPGMSQDDITTYFDTVHAGNRVIAAPPAAEVPDLAADLARLKTIEVRAPERAPVDPLGLAGASTPFNAQLPDMAAGFEGATMTQVTAPRPPTPDFSALVGAAEEIVPLEARATIGATPVVLSEPARLRMASPGGVKPPTVVLPPVEVPGLLDDLLARINGVALSPPDPQDMVDSVLNAASSGTYLACGSYASGDVVCAPTAVPLGVPVTLDLDANLFTGIAGQEVTVLLTPTVHPDYALTGFSALLRVDRTEPSALPTSLPLPAQVFVVYQATPAAVQVVAGFDGRDGTLGDTQSVRVTLKDVVLALAGDIRLLTEITYAGPGAALALVAGYAKLDVTNAPPIPVDPMVASLHFSPIPDTFTVDLRFADVGGQTFIEGSVDASESPTVTSSIVMDVGSMHREMVGVVEQMPTEIDFRIVSEAVGAVGLQYSANAPFPRFSLADRLVFDTAAPDVFTTLSAEVIGVPQDITFSIARPFNIQYTASDRVESATIAIASYDAMGLVSVMGGHVEGIPTMWSIAGDDSPLSLSYDADSNIDLVQAVMYDRAQDLAVTASAEAVPQHLDVTVEDGHTSVVSLTPLGTLRATLSKGGVVAPDLGGEFASYRALDADRLGASVRVVGFTSFDLDTRTTDLMSANVQIAGGEPFSMLIDDPAVYATVVISNLPTEIDIDLTPSTLTYDLAEPIGTIDAHVEVGTLAADVRVTDLPDQLTVAWTPTTLTWDANAPISRVEALLSKAPLLASIDIQSIPADFTLAWPSGTATFSTPAAIGQVNVRASVSGGSIVTLAGDHIALTKTGSAIGVSFRLSGIRGFSADPRNGGSYSLTLAPGGQPFRVYATVDAVQAQAYISNLPTQISVDLTPGTGRFGYTSTQTVASVWASAQQTGSLQSAYASLTALPARVNVTWTLGTAPVIVYDASGPLGSIYANFRSASGAIYDASVTSLPAYVRVAVAANDFTVDTRTSATAAAGSGVVGAITARYGSDGALLSGTGNHANLYQTATIARASLGYSGLKYARVSQVNDNLLVDIMNSAPRYFTAYAYTPEAYVDLVIDSIPAHVRVTGAGTVFSYDAFGQTINSITAYFTDFEGLTLSASVLGIPGSATVNVNMPSSTITYSASSAISAINIDAWVNEWYGLLRIASVPTAWTATFGGGQYAFNAGGSSIGSVMAAVTNHGTYSSIGGDHLTLFYTQGSPSTIDASLRVSGIRALSADPRNGGTYSLTLAPGGQPFRVIANVDGMAAQAYISNLPTQVTVDLTPGTGRFGYTATQPIASVWATAQKTGSPLSAYVSLTALPARVDVTWTLGASPVIVYDASGTLGSIYANFRTATGAVFDASLTSLPAYVRVAVAANDFTVDTRTSPTAAAGSGVVGAISARYGSDGSLLSGTGNHANLYQTSSVTRASLGYSGFKYARLSQVNDNLVVDIMNSAPRYFTAYAYTPEAYVDLVIDSIPAHVRVTGAGTVFSYDAFGQTINSITAYFTDFEGLTVSASVLGIPGSATVNVNMPSSTITYSASSAISAINIDAWVNEWYGLLRIASVPTAWTASFGNGQYLFDAAGSSIGSVRAAVTNHGTYTSLGGNHVSVVYVDGVASDTIDASLLMTQVSKAEYKRVGTNNYVDLRMGGGTPFTAYGNLAFLNGEKAYLSATFTPLPSSIQGSFGELTSITSSQNFNLYVYAQHGTQAALDATPVPPYVHGVAVRDGASGANRGVKAQLYLTGLPTQVTLDSRNNVYSLTNWRPTTNSLVADVELDTLVSPALDAYVSLSGIPSPQSMSFTMRTDDLSGGSKRTTVDITQTAPMGALFADATFGVNHGRVTVSNIPDDIHVVYTLANGQTTLAWDATAAIASVFAGFRVVTQSASFQGYASLTDIPSDFSMTFGRASGGQGPTMAYSATASTLDVNSYVDASLFGGDLKARLSFGLTNLGASTNVFVSGTGVRFTSSPATGSLYANVWGSYNYYRSDSGIWDEGGFLEFPWAYHLGVNPTVNNLAVTLTGFSDFSIGWGVTTKLAGTYSGFSFGWSSMSVGLDVYGYAAITVDWPWPFSSSTITLVNYHTHQTIPVNVLFHTYTNHQGPWFGVSGWAVCDWSLSTTIRPHPHGASWNGVSTSSSTAEGGAWYVVPNPYGLVPSWAVDLAARYTTPDGGSGPGLSFGFNCW